MAWWLVTVVLAATPVLHEGGGADAALATVAQRTGLPIDQLTALSLTDLRSQAPGVLGDAVIRRCTSKEATNGEVRAELVRAEAALTDGDDLMVGDHLDLAVVKLGCLSEVVDAPAVARVFLLRGAVAAEAGRAEEARGELATGLALHGELSWPPGYPAAGSTHLAEVHGQAPVGTLTVVPAPTSGPWVDGREPAGSEPLPVAKGLHLAQHSARTGLATSWLVVGGDAVWTLPEALVPSALDKFAAGDRDDLARVLLAAHPEEPAAYVLHAGGLWLLVRSGLSVSVEELSAPQLAPPPVDDGKKKKKKGKKG